MIPRTTFLPLTVALPFLVNALPQPQSAEIAVSDAIRSIPIAVDVKPGVRGYTEPITVIATREDSDESEEEAVEQVDNDAAKGKGYTGGTYVHTGSNDGVLTGSPPRAGLALVVGLGAVVIASLMG